MRQWGAYLKCNYAKSAFMVCQNTSETQSEDRSDPVLGVFQVSRIHLALSFTA